MQDAWKEYSPIELGWFYRLLKKRAAHRISTTKKEKDLYDAGNYREMLKYQVAANLTLMDVWLEEEPVDDAGGYEKMTKFIFEIKIGERSFQAVSAVISPEKCDDSLWTFFLESVIERFVEYFCEGTADVEQKNMD
jgi:hypothetical protein